MVESYSSAVHLGCSCLKLLLYLLVLLFATKIWFFFLLGSFVGSISSGLSSMFVILGFPFTLVSFEGDFKVQ